MANKSVIINNRESSKEQKTLELLQGLAQEYQSELGRSLSHLEISPIQAGILGQLNRSPKGLTVGTIKARQIDEHSNVSRALNKLMEAGLVKKKRSKTDQRVVHIHITQRGRAMYEAAEAAMFPVMKLPLSREDLDTLYNLLVKI